MAKTKAKKGRSTRAKIAGLRIVAEAVLPTQFGKFTILGIEGRKAEDTVVVLKHGNLTPESIPLVRIHSQCLTGDVLGSQRCDCRAQLEFSLRKIAAAPVGLLLYVPQEGRGIGLLNKLRAYQLQDQGMDTVQANEELGFAADTRDYRFTAEVLLLLGVRRVHLLSNNPDKVRQLERFGVQVIKRVRCQPRSARASRAYLQTKQKKLGHWLTSI
jgi:3,4-dihydroxy 2-butanone 4-phosphate synthase / GTP cyclohydrolase II